MAFTYHNGDILNSTAQVIAHQTNCLGLMGAGVAKAIRNKWPHVYTAYKFYCDRAETRKSLMGQCFLVKTPTCQVANLFGQFGVRREAGQARVTDYDALSNAMTSLRDQMLDIGLTSVAMPYKIGCGLGGGDWDTVRRIIFNIFADSGIDVEIWRL